MFKSILDKMFEDFSFVEDYGYFGWVYWNSMDRREIGIKFINKKRKGEVLYIAYSTEDHVIYAHIGNMSSHFAYSDPSVIKIEMRRSSYNKQIGKLREIIYARLNEKEMSESEGKAGISSTSDISGKADISDIAGKIERNK